MVSLDPFIGPSLNGRVLQLERRFQDELFSPNRVGDAGLVPSEHTDAAPDSTSARAPITIAPSEDHRVEEIFTNVKNMKVRIKRLERAKADLRERLKDSADALKDARTEAEVLQTQLSRAEDYTALLGIANEKVEQLTGTTRDLKVETSKYRRWWLTEYHSLKVVSALLPRPEEVIEILSSSQERFEAYSAGL